MPIEALNWSAIDETCGTRIQERISGDLSEFEVRSLREQGYLMNNIVRTDPAIQITDRQLNRPFHHSGGWAQGMIAQHLAQFQSDNQIRRGRREVSESDTEHKLIQFCLQRQAEKKPVTAQGAIDFMNEHHIPGDRFWVRRFLGRNQAVFSFQKERFLGKERHEVSEEDSKRYFEALTTHLQKFPSLFVWNADET
jgi:hypothetical protein